jgi:hypothetical protein
VFSIDRKIEGGYNLPSVGGGSARKSQAIPLPHVLVFSYYA